jgi:hypothetical protein
MAALNRDHVPSDDAEEAGRDRIDNPGVSIRRFVVFMHARRWSTSHAVGRHGAVLEESRIGTSWNP